MHNSAFLKMKACVDKYLPTLDHPMVVDFGSRVVANQKLNHKSLFSEYECSYIGIDINEGLNVDVLMEKPYSIPLDDNSVDIIITGQVIEHIPFLWASFLELSRVLKPGGYIFCTAPSRGHPHHLPYDCWRFYPESYRALAIFSNLCLLEVSADFPPNKDDANHWDYSKITPSEYWGDVLGVFRKIENNDNQEFKDMSKSLINWANKRADVIGINEECMKDIPKAKATISHGKFGILFYDNPDVIVPKVKNSIQKGWYETKEANLALKYLQKGDKVLELGGGLGFISTVTKDLGLESYVVIEADPRLISVIRETHKLNNVDNVLVQNCIATSDPKILSDGYCMLQLGNEFWGSTIKEKNASGTYVEVEAVPLKTYIKTFTPSGLIIDIEGGEVDLFDGVDLSCVDLIIMEVHPGVTGQKSIDAMIDLLSESGLKVEEKVHNDTVIVFKRHHSIVDEQPATS